MRVNVTRLVIVLLAATACSADTGLTTPSAERDVIADRLTQIADSISIESDEVAAAPYRELSDLVRSTEHPAVVRLAVDGEALPFSAVGHETIVTTPCAPTAESSGAAPTVCPRSARMRTLLAWNAPSRRILLVNTTAERGTFGAPSVTTSTAVAPASVAQLRFFDQSGRAGWATSGSYASNVKTEAECPVVRRPEGERVLSQCLIAHFQWELEAKTERRDDTRTAADATPPVVHTLRLASSQVDGTQWTLTAPAAPPAPPSASPLVAALRTHVDSVVSLALVVRNESDAPISLRFPSAQQHDFAILDRSGKTVWRWSDGKSFAAVITTQTIPAHESITFTERWRPTVHGELIVVATMASTSQVVSARAALTVP